MGQLLWVIVRSYLVEPSGTYLLAGDEVVVTKAGEHTHGVGRFYSSLAGRAIPGVSFLNSLSAGGESPYITGVVRTAPRAYH